MSYRNTRTRVLRGVAAAVLILQVAACDEAIGNAAEPEPSTLARSPMVEGTGPEEPAPPPAKRPSIPMARVPYGPTDSDELNFAKVETKCITLQWLGNEDVPEGVDITVTGVTAQDSADPQIESDAFTARLSGCKTPCKLIHGPAFRNSDETRCQVAVRAKRHGEAVIVVHGKVTACPAGQRPRCKAFADEPSQSGDNGSRIVVAYPANNGGSATDDSDTTTDDPDTTTDDSDTTTDDSDTSTGEPGTGTGA